MAADDTIGNYRLLGELGRGGMGIIYKAEQTSLGRFVALKVLYPHLVNDAITVKRFNHEARATALLNHPNIVQIFDVGAEEDRHYFAMEYVPGKDLAAVLENRGKLGVEETLRIADQVAAALSAASDVGIIHRDIKPSNILVDSRGIIKVTDFGIALAAGTGDFTDTGHLMGSVRYMSPEHARTEDLDSRSDLYALGIVMYEMLTGATPFDDESPYEVLKAHEETPPPPLPDTVPPVVQALVLRCLEKRRVDRFRTVRVFRRELRSCVGEIDWQGPALPPLESIEPTAEIAPDPSFRYDRAGVVRSVADTVSFCLAERLHRRSGFTGRLGRRVREFLGKRVRHRHDSYKMKRLEVMELRENLHRAETQLEEAKQECDRAHEKYEVADEELHGWQMDGSLSLDRGKKFSKEAAALQEKRLWQQATSYKLQWHSLQDRVRDWYQNVERARRDYEATVKELELLRIRRRRLAEETGTLRRNRLRLLVTVTLVVAVVVGVTLYGPRLWTWATGIVPDASMVYGTFVKTPIVMREARDEHAAAVLDTGGVLVTGGIDAGQQALASAEIFDVARGEFFVTGSLNEARFNHTMVTLGAGRGVLVIGGEKRWGTRDALDSVELFTQGEFVRFVPMHETRTRHRSLKLQSGKVLVTGGGSARGDVLASAEIFDPATNTFTPTRRTMHQARRDHAMTMLPDGRVVVSGGSRTGNEPLDAVEIFDPETETFEPLCSLVEARYEHTATAVDDTRVLVAGGRSGQKIED
ncbi:MAG TPA: protein kinase, partial [Planctomycetota bacterium]|nr:protein kinase [Planctomycetota bacterium]